jgi:hypothetical protein
MHPEDIKPVAEEYQRYKVFWDDVSSKLKYVGIEEDSQRFTKHTLSICENINSLCITIDMYDS